MTDRTICGADIAEFIGSLDLDQLVAEEIRSKPRLPSKIPEAPSGTSQLESQIQWASPVICFDSCIDNQSKPDTASKVIKDVIDLVLAPAVIEIWRHFTGSVPYDDHQLGGRWQFQMDNLIGMDGKAIENKFRNKGQFVVVLIIHKPINKNPPEK